MWSKQFYCYVVKDWLAGALNMPPPPRDRGNGRNAAWEHLFNRDVLSIPDKWEYPWYAAWDTAFHMIPFAQIDPAYTKRQLILFLREWYMHPSGALPDEETEGGGRKTQDRGKRPPAAPEKPWLFHEYFDAETGRGLGASHQTGWTALIVRCLEDVAQPAPTRAAGSNP
ncbi:MAG: hypothetical protein MUC88_15150 [Planctomycetes bacterium]|nr:hypothetical protein [Planctomycetota bacterium]